MKDRLGKYKKYIEFTIEELNKLPKSRREAITLGEKFYFNGNLCKYKHLSPRRRDAKCRKCVNLRENKKYHENSLHKNKIKIIDVPKLTKSINIYSKKEAILNNKRFYLTKCSKCHESKMLHDIKSRKAGCILCIRKYANEYAKKNYTSKPKKEETSNTIENILYVGAKQRAKRRNLDFNIQLSDIIIPKNCPIFGTPIKLFLEDMSQSNISRANSPSLDRIDSTKGYVKNNIIVLSYRANIVKGNGTAIEHRKIAQWMQQNLNN